MSFQLYEAALASSARTPRDRSVLRLLAYRAKDAGPCWPSVDRIADDTGLSERSVQAAIRSLVKAGHISIDPGGGRHGHTNRYHVHPCPCPARAARQQSRAGWTKQDENGGGTGAAVAPVATEGRNRDTPRVQPLHPTGANAAPHGRTGCTQTIREEKREQPTNHHGDGQVVVSSLSSQRDKKDRAGPPTLEMVLDFCFRENIPGDSGKTCFEEWRESRWCIDGQPIHNWQALLRNRRDRNALPADDEDTPAHRREPKGDWRALYRDTFCTEPAKPWSYLLDNVQQQMLSLWKKKKERDSWPAEEKHLLEFARLYWPEGIFNGCPLMEWDADGRSTLCKTYRKVVLGNCSGKDERERNAELLGSDWRAAIAAKCPSQALRPEEITAAFASMRQDRAALVDGSCTQDSGPEP